MAKAKKQMGVQQMLLHPDKEIKAILEYLCRNLLNNRRKYKKWVRQLYLVEKKVCLRKAVRPSQHETKPQACETCVLKLA